MYISGYTFGGSPSREAADALLNKVMGLNPDVLKTALRAIALNNH